MGARETGEDTGSYTGQGRILVAYFSRAGENYNVGVIEKGNTQIIAEMIAEAIGADLFQIRANYDYPESYDVCKEVASQEEANNTRPELAEEVLHRMNKAAPEKLFQHGSKAWGLQIDWRIKCNG